MTERQFRARELAQRIGQLTLVNVVVGLLRQARPANLDRLAKVSLGPLGVAHSVHGDVPELALGPEQIDLHVQVVGVGRGEPGDDLLRLPELLHRVVELVARQAHVWPVPGGPWPATASCVSSSSGSQSTSRRRSVIAWAAASSRVDRLVEDLLALVLDRRHVP